MTEFLLAADEMILGVRDDDSVETMSDVAVLIEDGAIVELGRADDIFRRFPRLDVLDGVGCFALPGLVNAHHHVGLTPFQLGIPDLPLERWALARMAARDVDPYLDTLVSAFEMISSGVTTVQHIVDTVEGGPDEIAARLREIARAYDDAGMRASICYGMADQNLLSISGDAAFLSGLPGDLAGALRAMCARVDTRTEACLAVFDALRDVVAGHPRLAAQLAAANLHWCSDDLLAAIGEASARHGACVHIHLLETGSQRRYARERAPDGAPAYLARLGLAGPALTLGHGTWLSPPEIEALAAAGTNVCINCSSNLRLRSGTAPLAALERHGVNTAIGIDEAGLNDDRDMMLEMRLVHAMAHDRERDPNGGGAGRVLRMATSGGARTTPFSARIGRLAPGKRADILLLDRAQLASTWLDADQPVADVVLRRATRRSVRMALCEGRPIWRNGRSPLLDRDAALAELSHRMQRPPTAQEQARRMLTRRLLRHAPRSSWIT